MVATVRRGASLRWVARRFRVALGTVSKWVRRAQGQRLDRVDWHDRPSGNPQPPHRTPTRIVRRVLQLRQWLKRHSPLGEYGALALRAQLQAEALTPLPAVRTIGRILVRHDQVQRGRLRRPPPPPGWDLPALADGHTELDAFDVVAGLVIRQGPEVEILNGLSLYGSLAAAGPHHAVKTADVLRALPEHWRAFGCPSYVQFDNDTRFQGSHRHPDCLGRVVHLCLCLGVVPVFVPPRETGFQAKIESFNDLWQDKVWQRWQHRSVPALARRSAQFVAAHRAKHAPRIDTAPPRLALPESIPHRPTQAQVLFLRRTNEHGTIDLLGRPIRVDRHWPHRLVRVELNVLAGHLQIFALRRRDIAWQPTLRTANVDVQVAPWYRSEA